MTQTAKTILKNIRIIDTKLYMTNWMTEKGRFEEEWLVSRRQQLVQQLEQELKENRHGKRN